MPHFNFLYYLDSFDYWNVISFSAYSVCLSFNGLCEVHATDKPSNDILRTWILVVWIIQGLTSHVLLMQKILSCILCMLWKTWCERNHEAQEDKWCQLKLMFLIFEHVLTFAIVCETFLMMDSDFILVKYQAGCVYETISLNDMCWTKMWIFSFEKSHFIHFTLSFFAWDH